MSWKQLGADPSVTPLFTGSVKGQDQALLYAVGTCLAQDEAGHTRPPVPCTEMHAFEVTGHADLGGRKVLPGDDAFGDFARPECERLAEAFTGRRLRGDLDVAWFPIDPASWAAGARRFECTISHYQGGVAQHVTGSLSALQTS